MTVRIAMASRVAIKFRAAVRRMHTDDFTNPNFPAAIDRGAAASAQVDNLHLHLPDWIGRCPSRIVASEKHASVHDGWGASALRLTRLWKVQI